MRLSSQSSQFVFLFPSDFLPQNIITTYAPILEKNWVQYDNVIDYINSTIKEVSIPGLSIDTPIQTIKRGKEINYKPATNIHDIMSTRELQIVFRSVDSDLNYFILWDVFIKHYLDVRHVKYVSPFVLTSVDIHRDAIYDIRFKEIILKTLSENNFSYSEQRYAEKTFTLTFTYNFIEMDFKLNKSKVLGLDADSPLLAGPQISQDPTTDGQFPGQITGTFNDDPPALNSAGQP